MTHLGSSGGWLGFIKTTKRNGKKKKVKKKVNEREEGKLKQAKVVSGVLNSSVLK